MLSFTENHLILQVITLLLVLVLTISSFYGYNKISNEYSQISTQINSFAHLNLFDKVGSLYPLEKDKHFDVDSVHSMIKEAVKDDIQTNNLSNDQEDDENSLKELAKDAMKTFFLTKKEDFK